MYICYNFPFTEQNESVQALAFDYHTSKLYWTDGSGHTIRVVRVPENTTKVPLPGKVLHSFKVEIPQGLAIDVCRGWVQYIPITIDYNIFIIFIYNQWYYLRDSLMWGPLLQNDFTRCTYMCYGRGADIKLFLSCQQSFGFKLIWPTKRACRYRRSFYVEFHYGA